MSNNFAFKTENLALPFSLKDIVGAVFRYKKTALIFFLRGVFLSAIKAVSRFRFGVPRTP